MNPTNHAILRKIANRYGLLMLLTQAGCAGETLFVGARADAVGSCSYSPSGWPAPNEQPICAGFDANTLPPPTRWLDDFEEGSDRQIFRSDISWSIEDDGTGNMLVPANLAPVELSAWGSHDKASEQGLRMAACRIDPSKKDATAWGVEWKYETPGGRHDTPPDKTREPLGLGDYRGLVLWARLADDHPDHPMAFLVQTPMPLTLPRDCGGEISCEIQGFCFAHLTWRISTDPKTTPKDRILESCWKPFVIPFDEMKSSFGDVVIPPDPEAIFGIKLAFNNTVGDPFDVLIDDIYLYSSD